MNGITKALKIMEAALEGFWNRHKWCVFGGMSLLLAGLFLGLTI